jgi:hypothetical protein
MKTLQDLIEEKKDEIIEEKRLKETKRVQDLKSIQFSEEDISELNEKIMEFNHTSNTLINKPIEDMKNFYEENKNLWNDEISFHQNVLIVGDFEIPFSFELEYISWDKVHGYGAEGTTMFFDMDGRIETKYNISSFSGYIPHLYSLNTTGFNPDDVNEIVYTSKEQFLEDINNDLITMKENSKKIVKTIRNILFDNIIEENILEEDC